MSLTGLNTKKLLCCSLVLYCDYLGIVLFAEVLGKKPLSSS